MAHWLLLSPAELLTDFSDEHVVYDSLTLRLFVFHEKELLLVRMSPNAPNNWCWTVPSHRYDVSKPQGRPKNQSLPGVHENSTLVERALSSLELLGLPHSLLQRLQFTEFPQPEPLYLHFPNRPSKGNRAATRQIHIFIILTTKIGLDPRSEPLQTFTTVRKQMPVRWIDYAVVRETPFSSHKEDAIGAELDTLDVANAFQRYSLCFKPYIMLDHDFVSLGNVCKHLFSSMLVARNITGKISHSGFILVNQEENDDLLAVPCSTDEAVSPFPATVSLYDEEHLVIGRFLGSEVEWKDGVHPWASFLTDNGRLQVTWLKTASEPSCC